MNNDEEEKFEDVLSKIQEKIDHWLEFAEAKNAALIAFIIAALATVIDGTIIPNTTFQIILIIGYTISMVFPLIAFIPREYKNANTSNGTYSSNDNLLFYKDISKYSCDDYINKVKNDYHMSYNNTSKYTIHMASEIITNSRIAVIKYSLFRKGIWMTLFTTIIFPILAIIIA